MTSVQWVYAPEDRAVREARFAAMNLADQVARHVKHVGRDELTELQAEALAIRRAELTWSDLGEQSKSVQMVKVQMGSIFWAVVLANLALGLFAALLYAINH